MPDTARIASAPADKSLAPGNSARARLRTTTLLSVYAVVPISVAIALFDRTLGRGALAAHLPRSPQSLAWFNVFFALPHIVASSVILIDEEYLRGYRRLLATGLVLAAAVAFALPRFASADLVLALNGLLTIHHVLAQQFGLALGIAGRAARIDRLWKWTGLAAGTAVYALFFLSDRLGADRLSVLNAFALAATGLFFAMTVVRFRAPLGRTARWTGYANFAMVASALWSVRSGYFFFAVLGPRVIHDVTAFGFYVVHDENRRRDGKPNPLLGIVSRIPFVGALPALVLTPAIAVLVAAVMRSVAAAAFVNFVTLFHYWTERYTWRKGTPHRASVSLGP